MSLIHLTRRNSFFALYHPFLPLLDSEKSPDDYYDASTLLFWVIAAVAARHYSQDPLLLNAMSGPVTRLLWATIADVPQSYVVVKALCILCSWPLPFSSTSSDPTFMLSGLMMQISLQLGLHRPSHTQDFTKFRIELREEELKDRVRTWAACNTVAQRYKTTLRAPVLQIVTDSFSVSQRDTVNLHLQFMIGPSLRLVRTKLASDSPRI